MSVCRARHVSRTTTETHPAATFIRSSSDASEGIPTGSAPANRTKGASVTAHQIWHAWNLMAQPVATAPTIGLATIAIFALTILMRAVDASAARPIGAAYWCIDVADDTNAPTEDILCLPPRRHPRHLRCGGLMSTFRSVISSRFQVTASALTEYRLQNNKNSKRFDP